jgi:hypothetical protein
MLPPLKLLAIRIQDDVHPMSFSDAENITMISSSQSKDVHDNYNTPTTSNPPEGKTTAVVAVMMGNPKDGYTCQCSNKHCKQRQVRVLLDTLVLMVTLSL